jgi:hypothetical protein
LTFAYGRQYADTIMLADGLHGRCERITTLLDALKETLPGLPGFRTLSLFGSLAEGRADEYSDIDIIITTDDLANAKAQLFGTLEQIGPIEFCWVMNLPPDEWNPTVVFREESYYHKLDLGLVDVSTLNRTIPDEQTVLLCDQHHPVQAPKESTVYAPEEKSIGHFLLGQFLGCTRYLKARRRGQTMTCYRFTAAALEWRIALLYARLTHDPHFRTKLSTVEYRELDRLVPTGLRDTLMSEVDFSNTTAMDSTLRTAMNRMLDDGVCLAEMVGESLSSEVFGNLLKFLDEQMAEMP